MAPAAEGGRGLRIVRALFAGCRGHRRGRQGRAGRDALDRAPGRAPANLGGCKFGGSWNLGVAVMILKLAVTVVIPLA